MRFDLDRPKDLAWSPDGGRLAVLGQRGLTVLDAAGTVVSRVPFPAGPLGIAWLPSGDRIAASGKDGKVVLLRLDAGGWRKDREIVLDSVGPDGEPDVAAGTAGRGRERNDPQVAGLAAHPDGRRLYAALGIRNVVVEVDLAAGKVARGVAVDAVPCHIALAPDGSRVAGSCRGGSVAGGGEDSAAARDRGAGCSCVGAAEAARLGPRVADSAAARGARLGRDPGGWTWGFCTRGSAP